MRDLKKVELDLILFLLKNKKDNMFVINKLYDLKVEEMNDGGMGSLKFYSGSAEKKTFGKQIAEVTLLDTDNIPVSFAINLDKQGEIYELDVFKADYSRLKQFPIPPYKIVE